MKRGQVGLSSTFQRAKIMASVLSLKSMGKQWNAVRLWRGAPNHCGWLRPWGVKALSPWKESCGSLDSIKAGRALCPKQRSLFESRLWFPVSYGWVGLWKVRGVKLLLLRLWCWRRPESPWTARRGSFWRVSPQWWTVAKAEIMLAPHAKELTRGRLGAGKVKRGIVGGWMAITADMDWVSWVCFDVGKAQCCIHGIARAWLSDFSETGWTE